MRFSLISVTDGPKLWLHGLRWVISTHRSAGTSFEVGPARRAEDRLPASRSSGRLAPSTELGLKAQ